MTEEEHSILSYLQEYSYYAAGQHIRSLIGCTPRDTTAFLSCPKTHYIGLLANLIRILAISSPKSHSSG